MQLKLHSKVKQSLCFDNVRGQYALLELFFFATTKAIVAKINNHVNFYSVKLVHILSAFWIWKVNSLWYKSKSELHKNKSFLGCQWLNMLWQPEVVNKMPVAIRISAENMNDGEHNFATI